MEATRFAHLLSPKQLEALCALISGSTVSAAAATAGVHRATLHEWLRHSQTFRAAVAESRHMHATALADRLQDLTEIAMAALEEALTSPEAPIAVRLRAALAVIKANTETAARTEPYRREVDDLITAGVPNVDDPGPVRPTEPATPHDTTRQNTTHSGMIARSAPCPCGSGRKYKRCCGTNAHGIFHGARAA